MEIIMNIAATVRCQDGKSYPCLVVAQTTDRENLLPSAEIIFTGKRPDFVVMSKLVVNFNRLDFGGTDRNESFYSLLDKAKKVIEQSNIIRR